MTDAVSSRKSDRTRVAILTAAKELFAERGYEGTTVRKVASRAQIDAAMVIRYFGSKEELFARASAFDLRLAALSQARPGDLGQVLVQHFLDVWEGDNADRALTVLLRSAASNEHAAARIREIFFAQTMPALATAGLRGAHAITAAGLISSQLLGLALCRYVLRLPPVVAMSRDELVRNIGQTIQRYAEGAR